MRYLISDHGVCIYVESTYMYVRLCVRACVKTWMSVSWAWHCVTTTLTASMNRPPTLARVKPASLVTASSVTVDTTLTLLSVTDSNKH